MRGWARMAIARVGCNNLWPVGQGSRAVTQYPHLEFRVPRNTPQSYSRIVHSFMRDFVRHIVHPALI